MDNVQGKPIRGIISDVQFSTAEGTVTALLESPDFCQGETGRNEITQGRSIRTSRVLAFDVVEGQLMVITMNSAYIVDGEIGIWEETLKVRNQEWLDSPTMSQLGLSKWSRGRE